MYSFPDLEPVCCSMSSLGPSHSANPSYLTCLLQNLYAGQEATVRTEHGTTEWLQIGQGVFQGYILSPAYLTYMQGISCEMPDWMKHKLDSRLPGKISITSDMQITASLWQNAKRNKRAS